MEKIILTVLLLTLPLVCFAQGVATQATPNADIDETTLINNLERAKLELRSFKGILKTSGSLGDETDEVFTKGEDKLYCSLKPDISPTVITMVQNGDVSYVYFPEANTVSKSKVSGLPYPSIQSFMYGLIYALTDDKCEHKIESDGDLFYKITIVGKNGKWVYWVNNKNWLIHKEESDLKLEDGTTMRSSFQWENIKINEHIPDSQFEFTIPKGAKVVEEQASPAPK